MPCIEIPGFRLNVTEEAFNSKEFIERYRPLMMEQQRLSQQQQKNSESLNELPKDSISHLFFGNKQVWSPTK